MSIAIERVAPPTEVVDHRPWWRGRPGQSMAVVAMMLLAFVRFVVYLLLFAGALYEAAVHQNKG